MLPRNGVSLISKRSCVLLAAVGLMLAGRFGFAQTDPPREPLSPRIANYQIDVHLNPETRVLDGRQLLVWVNRTDDAVDELQFHLYLNAFRNNQSSFMRESDGVHRGNKLDEDGWGFIEIERLAIAGLDSGGPEGLRLQLQSEETERDQPYPVYAAEPMDLTSKMEFLRPDDGNLDDKTVFRVPLPVPLQPGQTIALDVDFSARLPNPPFARTGSKEDYFFVGQWFPKVGVYEDGAWNAHQFHLNSEFYADFGVYDVKMTVPKEYILGATGQEVARTENPDGTATHHYRAEDVHDFAWTASPEFLEFTGEVQDVTIRALVQPDHAAQGERHLEASKVAVAYFQDHYGDYPYPNLTVVDPRRGAGGSGGMEYPTLITAGTTYRLPLGVRALEAVTIHEFGHNFWYHLVASNEFEEPWLDEGVNTYTHSRIMNDTYGPEGDLIDFLGIKLNNVDMSRISYIATPKTDPVYKNAWDFIDNQSYGTNSYQRPALILETLRGAIGPETMREILRTYVERWRFKHPKTQDFLDVVNDVTGSDWSDYFEQALFTTKVLDYEIWSVKNVKIEGKGVDFDLSASELLDEDYVEGQEGDESKEDGDGDKEDSGPYRTEVVVARKGEFTFPVHVEIGFEDGETIQTSWDGRDRWKRFEYMRSSRVKYATVDPERKIPLDVSYVNNSRTREKQKLGVNKTTLRWLFLWQFLLELVSP